ncbi:hypothetical protein R5R35_009470 [Gryllus longicercus]
MERSSLTSAKDNMAPCSDSDSKARSYWWRQHFAALAANSITLGTGMCVAWTASAQAVLRGDRPGSPLRLSLEQSSWVTALVPLGALLGALPAGLLAERLGRKGALLSQAAPEIAGWLLVIFTHDRVWMLYVARFLIGTTVGINIVAVSMYLEEISEVKVRGTTGSYFELTASFGMLLSYILGAILPYFWYTVVGVVPGVSILLVFSWMPESPVFLVVRGRYEAARKSLQWLRGPHVNVQPELDALEESLKKQPVPSQPNKWSFWRCDLPRVDRATFKSLAVACAIMFFSQANGKNAFLYYMTDVFRDAGSNVTPEIASIIVGAVYVAAVFLPTLTVDRVGRKPLLSVAYCVMGLSQLAMSVYTHLASKGYDVAAWRWVPLAALIIFIVAISSGPGPLSWFMLAELVPVEHRGWAISVAVVFGRIFVLVLIKEFPVMIVELGQDVTYGIFCVMCFLAIAFTLLCIPETKGKTRDEIKDELKGKSQESNEDCSRL